MLAKVEATVGPALRFLEDASLKSDCGALNDLDMLLHNFSTFTHAELAIGLRKATRPLLGFLSGGN